jgi:hypothetical protein
MTRPTIEEPWTQLATRIPKSLHQTLRVHCVTHDVTVMAFVVEALEVKLGKGRRTGQRKQKS